MAARPGWTFLGQVVAWVVIGAVTVGLLLGVLVPRLAGATPYTVLTGSMRPSLPPGTLVVVRPIDVDDIRTGDVITYQLESGQAPVVTHRVISVRHDLTGATTLVTQGDANDVPDLDPVLPVQIRGKVWYSVPYLGRANQVLDNGQRRTAVYLVAGGLLMYAGWMFTTAIRDRRRTTPSHIKD